MSDKKEVVINEAVLKLAEELKKGIKIDAKGVAVAEEGLYVKHLPEGLTEDNVRAFQKHTAQFIAASTLAFGQESIDVMKKHKDVDKIEVSIPVVDKDHIDLHFTRSSQVPAGLDGGTTTKFGTVSHKYVTYSAGPRGQVLKVKELLSAQATEAFGG